MGSYDRNTNFRPRTTTNCGRNGEAIMLQQTLRIILCIPINICNHSLRPYGIQHPISVNIYFFDRKIRREGPLAKLPSSQCAGYVLKSPYLHSERPISSDASCKSDTWCPLKQSEILTTYIVCSQAV